MKKLPINWGLISNPMNWVIVSLMYLIAAMAYKIATEKKTEGN